MEQTEADGRIHVTTTTFVNVEDYPDFEEHMEEDSQVIFEYEEDEVTLLPYLRTACLEKTDGTKLLLSQTEFSYDAAPYQLSDMMRQVIDGADKALTVIAAPGTKQEATYSISCGLNCSIGAILAEGYTEFYDDEACTQVAQEGAGEKGSERICYAAKGK